MWERISISVKIVHELCTFLLIDFKAEWPEFIFPRKKLFTKVGLRTVPTDPTKLFFFKKNPDFVPDLPCNSQLVCFSGQINHLSSININRVQSRMARVGWRWSECSQGPNWEGQSECEWGYSPTRSLPNWNIVLQPSSDLCWCQWSCGGCS